MSYTKGPWFISLSGADAVGNVKDFDPIGGCGCCDSPWVNGDTQEERESNARLIAAAPCLLEALKNLIEYDSGILPVKKQSSEYKAAVAAIRKAEGHDQPEVQR